MEQEAHHVSFLKSSSLRIFKKNVLGFENLIQHRYIFFAQNTQLKQLVNKITLCDELITRPEESYRLWCV